MENMEFIIQIAINFSGSGNYYTNTYKKELSERDKFTLFMLKPQIQ